MPTTAKYAPAIAAYDVTWNELTRREQINAQAAFIRNARQNVRPVTLFSRLVSWLDS